MIYNLGGNNLDSALNLNGDEISSAFDIGGAKIFDGGGEVPVDRNKKAYDYYNDPDPDKSYTWSYYLQSLKQLQNGHFTIGVQTDTHFKNSEDKYFATPLKNMTKQLYFDFICNLGDMPQGFSQDTATITTASIEEMIARYTDYAEAPLLLANGNHDCASMSASYIPKANMYNMYIGGVKSTTNIVEPDSGQELYYYKDFYECRVIVLNTCDYSFDGDVSVNTHKFSQKQINWFTNEALKTNKPVIVMGHTPLIDSLIDTDIPTNAEQIISAIEGFMSRGGVVVAYLCGHMHRQDSDKVNGVNHIVFTNGGTLAELVFIDFEERTIQTKIMNSNSAQDRTFTF